MIDHLSGDHREFFEPDKSHRAICNTMTMEAQITDTMRLPVINHGFLHTGDRISFTARGRTGQWGPVSTRRRVRGPEMPR